MSASADPCPTCGRPQPAPSPRDEQILTLLAQDIPRKRVAEALGLSLSLVCKIARLYVGPGVRGRPRRSRTTAP